MSRKIETIIHIFTLAVCIFLTVGVQLLFHACIHEDGSTGSCHWAQEAVFAAGLLLSAQAILLLAFRDVKARNAVAACMGCTAILTALLPDVFIRLCMMPSMHCQAYMKPWTVVCCVVIVLLNAVGFFLRRTMHDTSMEHA